MLRGTTHVPALADSLSRNVLYPFPPTVNYVFLLKDTQQPIQQNSSGGKFGQILHSKEAFSR